MTTVKEVITINVGGAGVRLGDTVLQQYMAEHGLDNSGQEGDGANVDGCGAFFKQGGDGRWKPRLLAIDTSRADLDDVSQGACKDIYTPDFLVGLYNEGAENFARGHYTIGKSAMPDGMDRLRRLLDDCNDCQGFVFQHSISGGTGSGLAALILQHIQDNYRKKNRFGFEIFGGGKCAQRTNIQVYNELLTTGNYLADYAKLEVSVPFDNSKVGEIMKKKFSIKPSFSQVNCYMSKIISSFTAPLRFSTDTYMDSIVVDTVLHPNLHFLTSSLAPVTNGQDTAPKSLAAYAVDPENMAINCPSFSKVDDKYTQAVFRWRGDVSEADARAAVLGLVDDGSVSVSDWLPATQAIRTSIHGKQAAIPGDKLFGEPDLAVAMIGNNPAMRSVLDQMGQAYDKLYSQRAFVHHFVHEGMEEGEMSEAREAVGHVEKDYLDSMTETDDAWRRE